MAKKPNKKPIPQAAPVRPASPAPAAAKRETVSGQGTNNPISMRLLCIVLAIISVVLYANTLMNGYVMDDVMVLKDNTMVTQGLKAIPELLSTPHMRGYLVIPNDLYRPLSLVMFAIEYQFFGLNPVTYHLFNILVFAGCVIMFFLFLDKLFGNKKTAIAFIGALIFAVHPIHTEVVANIKSRDELLCFFFGFWSLNLFINYMKSGKMMQLVLGSFILFLSYISKETVVAFLAVIPVLFFFYINDDKKRAIYITGGALLVTGIFMGIRSHVLAEYNANQPSAGVEFIDNALSAVPAPYSLLATKIVVLGKYLSLMFIPYPLLCTYSFNSIHFADFTAWRVWGSLLAYGAMLWFGITRFMKNRKDLWAFGIFFYLVTLFLFSNLPFLMGAELAERFAFFASAGFCIAVALAVEQFIIKADAGDILSLKATKVLAVLVPLSLIFGGLTVARNFNWKDNVTLYKVDVANSPEDCRLYHNVASAMAEEVYPTIKDTTKQRQMDEECLGYLRKGLQIYPEYADAHVEMGRIFDRLHKYDSAQYHDEVALKMNPINFTATNNLGSVYLTSGQYPKAILLFKKALELNANFKFPYINMARAYGALHKYDSAVMNYHIMLSFDPNSVEGIEGLGIAFYQWQRFDSAEYYFGQVLQRAPDEPNAVTYLGATYLNEKKYPQAISFFKKSIAINARDVTAYSNMARAFYFSQQYDAAIDAVNKELAIDQHSGLRDLPYVALSFEKKGDMANAKKYEAMAKQVYSNFKLD